MSVAVESRTQSVSEESAVPVSFHILLLLYVYVE